MLKKITANDPIWNDVSFAGEKILFNLLFHLKEYENPLLVTDGGTLFAAQTSPDMPAWVWTGAEVDPEVLRALCSEYKITKVTIKENMLSALEGEWKITRRLLANVCNNLMVPTHVKGSADRPASSDLVSIAEGIAGFHQDAMNETIGAEESAQMAERHLQNKDFVIWRTNNGEVAAFASIGHRTEEYARINMVYTRPHLRGNGYAGAAVADLCERILAEGLTPMLYTDALYPSSNRAYQKIGFTPVGEVVTAEH